MARAPSEELLSLSVVCLSGQQDSCVLFLAWSLPWGPSEPYRGRPEYEALASLPGESLPGQQAPELGRDPFSKVFPDHRAMMVL